MPGQRWQAHELEALQWFCEKRDQHHNEALRRGEKIGRDDWSWAVIAKKMNRVAARDEWEDLRTYTSLNCYTAMRKRQTLLRGSTPNVLEHPQPPEPAENPDKQQPLDRIDLTKYPSPTTDPAPRTTTHNESDFTPTPSPRPRHRVFTIVAPLPEPQFRAPPPPRHSPREDTRVFNLPSNMTPAPPYHWTYAEREALKEVYLLSGIGFEDNYTPGRRKGLWSWKMVATEMNNRARGAPWDVARTYTDASCHQKAKYYKVEWNDPRNIRPAGASCAPINDE